MSIDRLVSQRHDLLNSKFDVYAALIQKRLQNRESILDQLLQTELQLGNKRTGQQQSLDRSENSFDDLEQAILQVQAEAREEERICWRDLVPVIRDLLTTWEALEQAKSRATFLNSQNSKESKP